MLSNTLGALIHHKLLLLTLSLSLSLPLSHLKCFFPLPLHLSLLPQFALSATASSSPRNGLQSKSWGKAIWREQGKGRSIPSVHLRFMRCCHEHSQPFSPAPNPPALIQYSAKRLRLGCVILHPGSIWPRGVSSRNLEVPLCCSLGNPAMLQLPQCFEGELIRDFRKPAGFEGRE